MGQSTTAPKTYSVKVELTPLPDSDYYIHCQVSVDNVITSSHPMRRDMLYEQIQTLTDNAIRRVTTQLLAQLREQYKHKKDND